MPAVVASLAVLTVLAVLAPEVSPRGAGWLFGERPTQHFNRSLTHFIFRDFLVHV